MSIKTLIINPGSTSTKVGVFEDETLLFEETLRHPTEEIAKYASVIDQKDFRKAIILDFLKEKDCAPESLNVIVGRGGLLKPIPGGTYPVSDALLADLKAGVQGQHASNLGGILAREIGDSLGIPSYIVDPVVVDELTNKARISGMPELPRRSIFHALNQKAVARRFAKENGKRYEDLNLIVIHMGGGVSVGAHNHGQGRRCQQHSGRRRLLQPRAQRHRTRWRPGQDVLQRQVHPAGSLQEDLRQRRFQRLPAHQRCPRPWARWPTNGNARGQAGLGRLLLPDRQGRRRYGRCPAWPGRSDHPDRRHCLQPRTPRST